MHFSLPPPPQTTYLHLMTAVQLSVSIQHCKSRRGACALQTPEARDGPIVVYGDVMHRMARRMKT